MASTQTIGAVGDFQPENETISAYLERVSLFFDVNNVAEDKQVPWLLNIIGAKTYTLLRTLVVPAQPKQKTMAESTTVLKEHYEPKTLIIARRFYFHRRDQAAHETVAEYIAELRKLATPCEFGEYLDQALRDRLVCGLRSEAIQKRLLSEAELSLTKAVTTAQSMEAADLEAKSLRVDKSVVNMVSKATSSGTRQTPVSIKKACRHCGKNNHSSDKCFYKEATCHICKKTGHLAKVCNSRQQVRVVPQSSVHSSRHSTRMQWIDERSPTPEEEYPLFCVVHRSIKPITVEMTINGEKVIMEVDTGAAVSLMSQVTQERVFPQAMLHESTIHLRTYTGEPMEVMGELQVIAAYNGQQRQLPLYIVPGSGPTLLGREWLQYLKLDWKQIATVTQDPLQELLNKHHRLFEDTLGTISNYTAMLRVKESAAPKFHRPRPVPFAIREAIGSELDRLEQNGIIEKVDYAQWAAPIVPVPKGDGDFRICGDYKITINEALEIDQHPLPKPDELFAALTGGHKFTVLDLSQAYQQLKLHKDSKKYVTINTHQGLYSYTRLPFGVASAPAIFQRTMDSILQGIPQVFCYIDDILITGADDREHLSNLAKVLERLEAHGIKSKKAKCKFLAETVEYLGHKVDAKGIHTSNRKVEAIQKAPPQVLSWISTLLRVVYS